MGDYLTPEIGKVIPQLAQTCEDLVRQDLIRCLTSKTQEWCEGDPELAEKILEGKKTLPGCVKYVLEKAAALLTKKVEAMPKDEINALPTQTINGNRASLAGGMVDDETVYGWARDYYYKEEAPNNASNTSKTTNKKSTGRTRQKKETPSPAAPSSAKDETGEPQASDNQAPEQMTLMGAATGAAA